MIASALGLLLGLWVIVAGGCEVAAAAHHNSYRVTLVGGNRFALAVASLGGVALGVVVVAVAWVLVTRPPEVSAAG